MKQTFFERFTSRKFLLALATMLAVLFGGTGVDEQMVLSGVSGLFILVQGLIDRALVGKKGEEQ